MTHRIDFTNIFCAAFMRLYPKSAKRQSSHQFMFVLLGSGYIKASGKTLVKSALDFGESWNIQKIMVEVINSKIETARLFATFLPQWNGFFYKKQFTNILWATFAPIFCQKVTKPNRKKIKESKINFIRKNCCKMLVKYRYQFVCFFFKGICFIIFCCWLC